MNIAVLVKHVPDTAEADLSVAEDGRSVKAANLPYQMNEWDRFALEEAVRWKEKTGGTLTAFLVGPEDHEESLRRCLAVGADRAVRVATAAGHSIEAARLIFEAFGAQRFDLVLTGAQSSDDGYGLCGSMLARLLGVACATLVNRIEIDAGKALCTRELEGGLGEVTELDLPALVTVQTGINEPRYVSILGIKKAHSRPIDLAEAACAPGEREAWASRLAVTGLSLPPSGEGAEIWSGTPEEVATKFMGIVTDAGGVR